VKPSKTPYLLRALYDWILESEYTPYVLVDAAVPGVDVPEDFIREGRIVLNLAPVAVRNLVVGNDDVAFDGRFHGAQRTVRFPVTACLAIYARETGEGMMFERETPGPQSPGPQSPGDGSPGPGGHLRVVK
jgi:stringent starvation protein B